MSCEVYANGNEIACKAGSNKVIAEFPDVCLSPPSPPAGPIPVPYPDTSFSKDMKNGSKTVKIKKKEVMLKDKSFYKTSPLGDEAATKSFGGNVMSHNITGKTYCIAWSMDVKFEGKNVDRHLDMTTSNHLCAPTPPGTPPAGLTIGAMKPVIPGQKYTDQTCDDPTREDMRKELKEKKKVQRVQVPKDPPTDATKKGKLCAQLAKREQEQIDLLNYRQEIQDTCFASQKTTQDEIDEQDRHEKQYQADYTALMNTRADQARMGC